MTRASIALGMAVVGLVLLVGGPPSPPARVVEPVEVVVALAQPPVYGRALSSPAGARVERSQSAFVRRLHRVAPGARIAWRYRHVLNGVAVVLPNEQVHRLSSIPGVALVYPGVSYHSQLFSSPQSIGAPDLWGPTLSTAGDGIKIAIIDDGVDQTHPFFSPVGFTMPAGFPKGQIAYTSAKVIVARSFPPPTPAWKNANLPFDPGNSFHATHVAGIAAGNNGTRATVSGTSVSLSGVAPHAYIGNYKALTVPTPGFGLDGNSPEIAAAIEAAVSDGMNVINLSLGEPEIEPSHDLVVKALEGAAAAGVVPVVAAGNDFADFGRGSVGSPGTTPDAITVAASSKAGVIASFSSGGPTPISLQMKPDVTAPGTEILSSVPSGEGLWAVYQGTSMASPHIAGAAALLEQRHPTWTVAQIKSALVQTALPAYLDATRRTEASTTREGGGFVNLPRADNPLLFASPTGISFGLVRPGLAATSTVTLTDAGGGSAPWTVTLAEQQVHDAAVDISVPATIDAPGQLVVALQVGTSAGAGDHTGFVTLTRGTDVRRIPYWFVVASPRLGAPSRTLPTPGVYSGNTLRGSARVSSYRYPDGPEGAGVKNNLAGPEQVFRVRISRPVANFGVVVTRGKVEPRVVVAGNENRLTGYAALPLNINPYGDLYGHAAPVAGAILPAPGLYDLVFDEAGTGGPFTFRYWVDDVTPPRLKLLTPSISAGQQVRLSATDNGAGVDPATISAKIDGTVATARFADGTIRVSAATLSHGSHALTVSVADHQEAKNMENVARILPNTRTLQTTVVVR